ncbi:uncharacterized protein [Amphiura filiformis]|uniref:uncharacterized protein n=1 Tax=Amphiura filiformis TaxID=82378 RepID=UPI003B225B13
MAEYAGKLVVFGSEEEVNQAIKQYEEDTIAHFVVGQKLKGFTSTELQVRRLCWYLNSSNEVKVPYDGVPFSYAGKLVMRCHHGPDKCKKQKVKYMETRMREEAAGTRKYGKARTRKTPLKKVDCPAKISIKKVVKFPEFKLQSGKETEFGKKMASKAVMEALQKEPNGVKKEVRYYVMFAAITDHKNHEMGELAAKVEPVDERVLNALHGYALAGVRSCTVLQKLGITFVENELFKDKAPPPRSRRRFYPSLSDIRNFLYKNKEELSKANSDMNSQFMSELGVDVASTSTTMPSGDDDMDSAGIVALMNVAVNNQYIQQDLTTTTSSTTSNGMEQQPPVPVCISSNQAKVAETLSQAQSGVQSQSFTQSHNVVTLTQTQAFTRPITQSDPISQSEALFSSSALPPSVSTPYSTSTSQLATVSSQAPTQFRSNNQTAVQEQKVYVQQSQQIAANTLTQQQFTMQPHDQQQHGSLPSHLQEVEIPISHLPAEPQQIDSASSLQQQVANTLEQMSSLSTQQHLQGAATVVQSQQQLPQDVSQQQRPSRLRLILRLKDLTRQIHDYALLVKDTDNLQTLVTSLEGLSLKPVKLQHYEWRNQNQGGRNVKLGIQQVHQI